MSVGQRLALADADPHDERGLTGELTDERVDRGQPVGVQDPVELGDRLIGLRVEIDIVAPALSLLTGGERLAETRVAREVTTGMGSGVGSASRGLRRRPSSVLRSTDPSVASIRTWAGTPAWPRST